MTSPTDTQATPPGDDPRAGSGESAPREAHGAPPEASQPAPPPAENKTLKRLQNYSVLNMVYSLLAVFALVFGLWALMPTGGSEPDRRPVEVGLVASYAATESAGPIWSPEALGWRANFANYQVFEDVVTWRVGLVTPSEEYVEISQADEPDDGWVSALTEKAGDPVGTRTITGPDGSQEWTAYEGEERAVLLGPGEGRANTTVVRGTAQWPEIEEFIGRLEVAQPD